MMFVLGNDKRVLDFLETIGVADAKHAGRVIIDIPADAERVRVYVTCLANEKGFDIRFESGDFKIVEVASAEPNSEPIE